MYTNNKEIMENQSIEETLPKIKEQLEFGIKVLLFIGGLCYALGLIVVNLHLSQYGVYSLGLFQLNYVMAGIWCLIPILLDVAIIAAIVHSYLEKKAVGESKKFQLFGVIAAIFAVFVVISIILDRLNWIASGKNWLYVLGAGVIGGPAIIMVFIIITFLINFNVFFSTSRDIKRDTVGVVLLWFISIAAVIFYTTVFVKNGYNQIPSGLGGGRPSQVRLVIEKEKQDYIIATGIKFDDDVNKSKTELVYLILSTDKEYIVVSKNAHTTVSISSDIVKALITEKK